MIGKEIHKFAKELWPLNRSLTGSGVRKTLNKIKEHLPELQIKAFNSGTRVFDWTVPKEWFVKEAYIKLPNGKKICNFKTNNLHLVGYSQPFVGILNLKDLKKNLHTLPEQPNAIPYITSYYEERWGFCLSQNEYDTLEEGEYKVKIDSKLFNGQELPVGGENAPPAPQTLSSNTQPTYVPTKMTIGITLLPVESRRMQSQRFSVRQYANGDLLKGGMW